MKKFISMVMAAAMVVSLVPATAFAATGTLEGKTYVENADTWAEDFVTNNRTGFIKRADAAEVQFEIDNAKIEKTDSALKQEFTIELDGAEFANYLGCGFSTIEEDCDYHATKHDRDAAAQELLANLSIDGVTGTFAGKDADENYVATWIGGGKITLDKDFDETTAEFTLTWDMTQWDTAAWGSAEAMLEDAVLAFDLQVVMDGTDVGDVATVSVSGDFAELTDAVFAEVVEKGISVTCKEAAEVAEGEETDLKKEVKVESVIGNFSAGQEFELSLSNGFEFVGKTASGKGWTATLDGEEAVLKLAANFTGDVFKIAVGDLKVEAIDAKAGDECVLTIESEETTDNNNNVIGFEGEDEVVIAVVLADEIIVEVEDDDVPIIYSGVDVANTGITDNSKHVSLEVTVKESVADAWDFKPGFEMTISEGVFVTKVDVTEAKNIVLWDNENGNELSEAAVKELLEAAYVEGDQEGFVVDRKTIDAKKGEKAEVSFKLTLVAEPTFVGDVVLGIAGQEVVIANFVAPYTVEAASNDLVIDYRNTEVPTTVVIKEAEAGLWKAGTTFTFVEDDHLTFEGDAEVTVDEASEMELNGIDNMSFTVKTKSDDEPAVVTISGIELYMSRNLPAGAYDLNLTSDLLAGYIDQTVVVPAAKFGYELGDDYEAYVGDLTALDLDEKTFNVNTTDASYVAKEGWVNVVTAGRDADDASFTTTVVVPVGSNEIIAGESVVALDVPAYINAAGYTMLPVRAVSVALGIHNNNVLWDQASKTVTILYGQRIITMTVGAKVINVNGSAIPASAAVEIVDGRTFLGLRDLATALGVVDITWDAATQTATLNGNK